MRMQARLLLSQDIFSLLKKPTTWWCWCCCCGGGCRCGSWDAEEGWEEVDLEVEVVGTGEGVDDTSM
jgi:hypothetical protein